MFEGDILICPSVRSSDRLFCNSCIQEDKSNLATKLLHTETEYLQKVLEDAKGAYAWIKRTVVLKEKGRSFLSRNFEIFADDGLTYVLINGQLIQNLNSKAG